MRILVTPKHPTAAETLTVLPSSVVVTARPLRILDLDVEARPLHWIARDYVSKEITAMAWAWTDAPNDVTSHLLGETDPVEMLQRFRQAYLTADMVTGHFIRGYDLPMINGALMEYRLPALSDKLTHDTKLDLIRRAGLSMSQENLGAMLRLEHKKVQMNQARWRAANRLELEGLAMARERVCGDVQQHIELRRELVDLGYVTPPKVWKSGTARGESYEP